MSETTTWDGKKGHYERVCRYPNGDYGHEEENDDGRISSRHLSPDDARRWFLANDYDLPDDLANPDED
jgi:hypothetical protein